MIDIGDLKLDPNNIPQILLPYQIKWIADKTGIKLCTKSRRIGMSWAEASDCALSASEIRGENTFYIGYDKPMAQGFVKDAADWAKAYNLICSQIEEDVVVEEDKDIHIYRIYFNSGFIIESLSSSPRNMRSRQGRIVIDEAAFHDDFPALFKAAKALRIWGSNINIITTYNGIDGPYPELEKDVLSGKFPYSRHFVTFKDAIAQGLFQRICLVTGKKWSKSAEAEWISETLNEFGEDANEELFCIPQKSGGAYFTRILIENCMEDGIPILKLKLADDFILKSEAKKEAFILEWLKQEIDPIIKKLDLNARTFYGMDFARSKHGSIAMFAQESTDLTRKVFLVLELRNIPFEQQKQIMFYIVDRCPNFQSGANDARGNGQYLAEVLATKYPQKVAMIMTSEQWYADAMPKYKAAFEDKKIVLPKDADILADHRLVQIIQGIPKIPKKTSKGMDGEDRHGDGASAGCLMWYASQKEPSKPVYPPSFGSSPGFIDSDSLWFVGY